MLRRIFERKVCQDRLKVQASNGPIGIKHDDPILWALLVDLHNTILGFWFLGNLRFKVGFTQFDNLSRSLIPWLREECGQN